MSKTNETELFTIEELKIIFRSLVLHATDDRVKNDYSKEEVETLSLKSFDLVNKKAFPELYAKGLFNSDNVTGATND